jgi:hypothetical protein
VAILAATAAFGGLGAAATAKPVSLGQEYVNGPLRITAHALDIECNEADVPSLMGYDIRNGKVALVFRVTIENLVDEDILFGGGDATRVFELQPVEPQGAYGGVFPEGARQDVTNIAARMSMNASVIWMIPSTWLTEISTVQIVIRDLEKSVRVLVPSSTWFSTLRETGGQLTVPLRSC